MSATTETLELLKSIDTTLKHLLALAEARKPAQPVDLDSERGNFIVKAKDPRDWTLEPMTGKRLSECPATYLDLLAKRFEFFNEKETDEKKQRYNRMDAARARGWAERVRAGYKAATPAPEPAAEGFPSDMMKGDDIEF